MRFVYNIIIIIIIIIIIMACWRIGLIIGLHSVIYISHFIYTLTASNQARHDSWVQ